LHSRNWNPEITKHSWNCSGKNWNSTLADINLS
jgi:hypothetical protein